MPLFVLLLLFGTAVSTGGVTHGAVQQLAGRPVRIGAMLWTGLRRGLPLLAALLLVLLAIGAGLLLLVVPGLVVTAGLTVSIPALVGERIGPIRALRRSWQLTRDFRLPLFLAALVIGLLQLAVNTFTDRLLPMLMGPGPATLAVSIGVSLLFLPVPSLFPAVAWHELRVAKEGAATQDILAVFE